MLRFKFKKKILKYFILLYIIGLNCFAQNNNFVLTIDPGHGGKDFGAKGFFDLEKNITLDISLILAKKIIDNNKDIKVVLTRDSDVFVELNERTEISNKNKSNLFISIHCNSSSNPSAFGTETFVMGLKRSHETDDVLKRENSVVFLEDDHSRYEKFNPNDPQAVIAFEVMNSSYKDQSIRFSKLVEKKFSERFNSKSRGVKQANFHVLRNNASPSVLIEVGFISNYQEGLYLSSEEGKNQIADYIYKAFLEYKKDYDMRTSSLK